MINERSESKLDISSNKSVSYINHPKENSQTGILEKLEMTKRFKKIEEHSFTFVPISMDQEITQFIEQFISCIIGKKSRKQIGSNKYVSLTGHPENGDIGLRINLYTYNYIIGKKFKYLRNEAIQNSDNICLIINIYNSKSVENLKQNLEEIKDASIHNSRKSFFAILLTFTNNLLAKLLEKQTTNYLKKELMSLGIDNIFEINNSNDYEGLIKELISYK